MRRPASRRQELGQGREGRPRRSTTVAEAAKWADIIMMLINDERARPTSTTKDIAPYLDRRQGPGLRPRLQHPLSSRSSLLPVWTCSWLPPRAPATPSASTYVNGQGRALPGRRGAGRHRQLPTRSLWPTSPASAAPVPVSWRPPSTIETETDLFGEQTVLCGGVVDLMRCGFEVLVRGRL